jgi:hypothetical protein
MPEAAIAPRADAAGWLALAAAPTFALMALWTGLSGDRPDMLCMSGPGASPLGGMAAMYALMAAFHAAPWLRWIGRRGDSPSPGLRPPNAARLRRRG